MLFPFVKKFCLLKQLSEESACQSKQTRFGESLYIFQSFVVYNYLLGLSKIPISPMRYSWFCQEVTRNRTIGVGTQRGVL